MWNYCKALRSCPGFNVDQPPNDDNYTTELFAMVRVDDFDFQLSKIFNNPVVGAHTIRMQRWPRDLDLRKGMLSGYWKDISTIVSCRDASVFDANGAG